MTQNGLPDKSNNPVPEQNNEMATMSSTVEAILFACDSPVTLSKLSKISELPQATVKTTIEHLNERYVITGNSFRICNIAGGFQMMSLPEFHDVLSRLRKSKKDSRLTRPTMETLAIVAYRQPIIRADVEAIRGVACGDILRNLMEKQLVKVVGRAEIIGRPMLYGTTKKFLEVFGLGTLNDLPRSDELKEAAVIENSKSPETKEEAEQQENIQPDEQSDSADEKIETGSEPE